MYLFYISIFIIIFHKIVSSLAIYHLTKKKSFFFYQLFDVLLVRCVWINYKLNIDEPSNVQRYLQVFEAILESAPQLLVSSAFIIKTDTYSTIILLSLLTSFWTLTSRVVADDKQMLSKEWKEFEFLKEYKITSLFNYKYIIRVIFWRFLEISSRVTLICLIWINLGGFAVIIIIWLEIIYLSYICYGVGSFSMLCNIIYLTASSSTQKSSQQLKWAISMGKLFWAYRILSSWLFLIIITITATIKFDAWKIDDYQTRHNLTFNQNIGLFFYIFTWIAQPIWQWVAAIVVFDYNNLHSVSRDVKQLCQQNQWKDVIELIQFGCYNVDYEYLFISSTKQIQFGQYGAGKILNPHYIYPKSIAEACLKQFYVINETKNVFFRSIYFNHKQSVTFMIDQNFDVNTTDNNGRTGLHYAAAHNNYDMVRMLIKEKNCDCTIRDNDNLTALHFAVLKTSKNGIKLNVLQCLIEDGYSDVSTMDNKSTSLLDTARKTQNKQVIKKLISYGASFNFDANDTPYFLGCYQGFVNVVQKALNDEKNAINVNSTDKTNKNRSGLHYALISTSITQQSVIGYLLKDASIDPNIMDDDGFTALHLAIIALPTIKKNIIESVLNDAKSYDLEKSIDNYGYSILDAALFKKNSFVIDTLIAFGAKINADKYNEYKLIDFYFTMCYDGKLNTIKHLISDGIIDINCVDANGRNGLHYACYKANEQLIALLIELNIDVNHKDDYGFSPLHFMIYAKRGSVFRSSFKPNLLKILIINGQSDVNSMDDYSNTILQTAKKRQTKTIYKLLKNQYNAELCKDDLYTPHNSKIALIKRKSIALLSQYMNGDDLLNTQHLRLSDLDENKENDAKTDASAIAGEQVSDNEIVTETE